MNERLTLLIQLQTADDLIRRERLALAEAEASLAAARSALARTETALTGLKKQRAEEEARHRAWEGEAADLAARKKKNAARLAAAQNEGEYAALGKEADFLAKKLSDLEDEALALLDTLDRRGEEIAALTETAEGERAALAALTAQTEDESRKAEERLAELAVRRVQLSQEIGPALIRQYDETARTKGGLAVTAAADGLCLACRLSFPPQFYNGLQRNEGIFVCPNCGRIIYWRDHPDFQPPPAAS